MNNQQVNNYTKHIFNIYQDIVHKILSHITTGGINLETECGSFYFGNPEHLLQATIKVKDNIFFKQIFWRGGLGLAETYMSDKWDTNDLTKLLQILALNMKTVVKADYSLSGIVLRFIYKISHYFSRNNLQGSKKNISKHYDLGNDFFNFFLDTTMMYSCAKFNNAGNDLEQASLNKLKYICLKLELKSTDHILEIGTGWGGFAIYAVQNFNCRVTTTTISKQQFDYTVAKVAQLGLQHKIEVLLQDYREIKGKYDKLVSIEMIEAVGHQYFKKYFSQCSNLLKSDGLFLLQAIIMPEQRYEMARDSVDFIKLHIFPGGCLPSMGEILKVIKTDTDYTLVSTDEITHDYAKTLCAWRHNFTNNYFNILQLGFDRLFMRKWLYYFSYCESAFLERAVQGHQILFAKPAYRAKINVG